MFQTGDVVRGYIKLKEPEKMTREPITMQSLWFIILIIVMGVVCMRAPLS